MTRVESNRSKIYFFLLVSIIILYSIILFRSAWVGDDAYITFRVVDNFLNGFGLTWNIGERVQVYTNPLWMFFMIIFNYFNNNIYLISIIFSLLLSLSIPVILSFYYRNNFNLILIILILTSSKSFIDYSVSGLENPLNSVLIVIFYTLFLNRKSNQSSLLYKLILIASFAFVSRIDMILFFIVPLLYLIYENIFTHKVPFIRLVLKSFLMSFPAWLWLSFALLYYGFVFPNTYYAKLTTGISSSEYISQGLMYFIDLISNDPITIIIIIVSIMIAFHSKNKNLVIAAVSIILYCLYIIRVGGDFMAGRFFNPVVLLSSLLIFHIKINIYKVYILSFFILFISFMAPYPTWKYSINDNNENIKRGIADERGFYYKKGGLLSILDKDNQAPSFDFDHLKQSAYLYNGRKVLTLHNMGYIGYSLGPEYCIIDKIGLTDPFISKLPIFGDFQCHEWRVGHYERQISQQYLSSVIQSKNNFKDDSLGILYEAIKTISEGDLFSAKRLNEIFKFNFGAYKLHALSLLNQNKFDYPVSEFKILNGVSHVVLNDSNIVDVIVSNSNNEFSIYGPYVGLGKGKFQIDFQISGSSSSIDIPVIEIDVFEFGGKIPLLAQKQITGGDLASNEISKFQFIIDHPEHRCDVEFRLRQLAPAQIRFKGVSVRKLE